jgi:uncharacterized membrane protein
MNAIFAAGLVLLALFLAFVGVLATVQPAVERVSYLKQRFDYSVYASLAGVVLSSVVSAGALAKLSGARLRTDLIVFLVYLLIIAVVAATFCLAWAIGW